MPTSGHLAIIFSAIYPQRWALKSFITGDEQSIVKALMTVLNDRYCLTCLQSPHIQRSSASPEQELGKFNLAVVGSSHASRIADRVPGLPVSLITVLPGLTLYVCCV